MEYSNILNQYVPAMSAEQVAEVRRAPGQMLEAEFGEKAVERTQVPSRKQNVLQRLVTQEREKIFHPAVGKGGKAASLRRGPWAQLENTSGFTTGAASIFRKCLNICNFESLKGERVWSM